MLPTQVVRREAECVEWFHRWPGDPWTLWGILLGGPEGVGTVLSPGDSDYNEDIVLTIDLLKDQFAREINW